MILTEKQNVTVIIDPEFDLCVEMPTGIKKVQVIPKGRRFFEAELQTKRADGKRRRVFGPNSVDYLYVLTGDGDRYFIPTKEIKATSTLSLGIKCQAWKV